MLRTHPQEGREPLSGFGCPDPPQLGHSPPQASCRHCRSRAPTLPHPPASCLPGVLPRRPDLPGDAGSPLALLPSLLSTNEGIACPGSTRQPPAGLRRWAARPACPSFAPSRAWPLPRLGWVGRLWDRGRFCGGVCHVCFRTSLRRCFEKKRIYLLLTGG